MKTVRASAFKHLQSVLHRFYPLPEALLGYLFGVLTAALTVGAPVEYDPLPFRDALFAALAAELPFYVLSAILVLLRPTRQAGSVLVLLKGACCGFGAEHLLFCIRPLVYFSYVVVSILQTALYACPIRCAAEQLGDRKLSNGAMVDYLLRWLFYSGCALLLTPLKYLNRF